ncbi:MAG TPA: hypothetical protein VMM37_01275, partial [Bacteroidota bacterium]|nr:hypothetical protein [Bacteroidota bacterium]
MDHNPIRNSIPLLLIVAAAFIFLGAVVPSESSAFSVDPTSPAGFQKATEVVSLRDFTKNEVRGVGITLTRDITVHISATGGGDESFWQDAFGSNESQQMYAAGWIINADTRECVWDMTIDNTSGRSDRRTVEKDLMLKKGSYEVYFQAYGYASGGSFSHFSMNIDRRERHRSSKGVFGGLLNLVGADVDEHYDDFMDYARDRWGIAVTVAPEEASSVQTFTAPMKRNRAIIEATGLGDDVVIRKTLDVRKDVKVHIYALGEGQKNDDVVDYGWIVNTETRQRVWDMNLRDVDYAGGASKNVKYEGDVTIPGGRYELCFVTDGSHSNDDWNARPPYDPFNYGVTITVNDQADERAVTVTDGHGEVNNVIVQLTKMGDDDYKEAGFSLKKEMPVRIYALGESDNDRNMADYGWIVNAKSHERVWTMERRETYHAGGASKNRLADEVVTLPRGTYTVYYQTDGSHSYDNWNSDPPFDPEHWGITLAGVGNSFDAKDVATVSSNEKEEGVLAQLIRVRDDEHERQRFSVTSKTNVRVYAIGESDGDEMADYGWISNAETGQRVWEMEYDKTSWAGGAKKNRVFDKTITLDKGTYELHFRTDGSHAWNDW